MDSAKKLQIAWINTYFKKREGQGDVQEWRKVHTDHTVCILCKKMRDQTGGVKIFIGSDQNGRD